MTLPLPSTHAASAHTHRDRRAYEIARPPIMLLKVLAAGYDNSATGRPELHFSCKTEAITVHELRIGDS
jgi:hypothetical protein